MSACFKEKQEGNNLIYLRATDFWQALGPRGLLIASEIILTSDLNSVTQNTNMSICIMLLRTFCWPLRPLQPPSNLGVQNLNSILKSVTPIWQPQRLRLKTFVGS